MSPAKEGIYVEPGTPADEEQVFRFLQDHFYPYEPVSQTIGFPRGPPNMGGVKPMRGLDHGTVLVARDPSMCDRIVGVAMCLMEGVDQGRLSYAHKNKHSLFYDSFEIHGQFEIAHGFIYEGQLIAFGRNPFF